MRPADVRRRILTAAVLAVAIALQLTVLNGLRLPGGGVPDLVLVLVAALAMGSGPVAGMAAGFTAGLVLDLAPPGSPVLGEYALVFCLAGFAAGQLRGLASRSALLSLLTLAGVVAVAEAALAGIELALDPAQVSLAQIRLTLPADVICDLLLLPFALLAAMLLGAWATREPATGPQASPNAAAAAVRRPGRKAQPRTPRLAAAAARPHDGWVGTGPPGLSGRAGALRRPAVPHGLHPARGVAGSAVTGAGRHPGHPGLAAPANLRFSGRRRGDGAVGNPVGSAVGHRSGLHPGLRRGASPRFRPHAGVPGGSAAGQAVALVRRPSWRRPTSVRFAARRGDATVGRLLGTPRPAGGGLQRVDRTGRSTRRLHFGRAAAPRFRTGSLAAPRSRPKAEPRFRRQATSSAAARSRPKAQPRFRRHGTISVAALGGGKLPGGAVDVHDLMAARRRQPVAAPRLRLGARRRGDGRLGGSASGPRRRSVAARPAAPRLRPRRLAGRGRLGGRKQPRFGHGRYSLLRFLTGWRIGGRWLASTRTGSRAGMWLIGRRTGGLR